MTKLSRFLLCVILAGLTTAWAVILAGLTTAWAVAQYSDNDTKSKGEVRSITGCLTHKNGGEYLLTGTDGSTWEVHENNGVDLAKHVNQTVEVKGVVSHAKMHNMKEDEKEMAHDTGAKNNTAEHGHLKVTDVHKVADTCQQ
jgi:hypothetical protein